MLPKTVIGSFGISKLTRLDSGHMCKTRKSGVFLQKNSYFKFFYICPFIFRPQPIRIQMPLTFCQSWSKFHIKFINRFSIFGLLGIIIQQIHILFRDIKFSVFFRKVHIYVCNMLFIFSKITLLWGQIFQFLN